MVKSIEEYTAEISKSYDNSRNALQNQINSIEGDLAKTKGQIEENYANQQNQLGRQRNSAASAASMQAAGSGGSFGGAANIANKKYYEQVFVPAQASLNTNYNQSIDNAESRANSNRLSLESQLASMNDEISRLGVQRYYDELEREREEAYRQQQLELERQRIAASRSGGYGGYGGGGGNTSNGRWRRGFGNDPNGYYFFDNAGNAITAQQFANNNGRDIREYLQIMAQNGDFNASRALAGLNNANHELTDEENSAFGTLGIDRTGWGWRA